MQVKWKPHRDFTFCHAITFRIIYLYLPWTSISMDVRGNGNRLPLASFNSFTFIHLVQGFCVVAQVHSFTCFVVIFCVVLFLHGEWIIFLLWYASRRIFSQFFTVNFAIWPNKSNMWTETLNHEKKTKIERERFTQNSWLL